MVFSTGAEEPDDSLIMSYFYLIENIFWISELKYLVLKPHATL
jgi:hypothetical protein